METEEISKCEQAALIQPEASKPFQDFARPAEYGMPG